MRTATALVILLAACGGGSKPPPVTPAPVEPAPVVDAPPPTETSAVLAASALAEQYEVGKQVWTSAKCDTCHESDGSGNAKNPAVMGAGALPEKAPKISKLRKAVTFTTAADVVAFTHARMPIDKPGSLAEADAYAVVAWILDTNKVALTAKLDATTAPMVKLR